MMEISSHASLSQYSRNNPPQSLSSTPVAQHKSRPATDERPRAPLVESASLVYTVLECISIILS